MQSRIEQQIVVILKKALYGCWIWTSIGGDAEQLLYLLKTSLIMKVVVLFLIAAQRKLLKCVQDNRSYTDAIDRDLILDYDAQCILL